MKIFQKKAQTTLAGPNQSNTNGKFRTFAYYLAWISFLSTIGGVLFDALKDHEPPKKDEYYK